jgi:hypothetical protein
VLVMLPSGFPQRSIVVMFRESAGGFAAFRAVSLRLTETSYLSEAAPNRSYRSSGIDRGGIAS